MAPLFFLLLFSGNFQNLAAPAHGRVGVLAQVSGSQSPVAALDSAGHYPMQSVYKFPISMAILRDVDRGILKLDQPVLVRKAELVPLALHSPIRDEHPAGDFTLPLRDVIRYAVSESDGTACDVLLRLAGGPAKVEAFIHSLGVTEIAIATTEMTMSQDNTAQYRNWATPRGMVQLLDALQQGKGLSPVSRALILKFMTDTPTGPNRIKALLPAGTVVAHKTGSSGTANNFTAALNDVGLITLPDGRTLALAVFVSDATAEVPVLESVIAKVARAAFDAAAHPRN